MGPGTVVGSAAVDTLSTHAVCVSVPKDGQVKKISDIGVLMVALCGAFWAYIWLYIILKVKTELLKIFIFLLSLKFSTIFV